MNNQNPFFNPFIPYQNINIDNDKLINKIDRLEKEIRIIENRLNNIEKNKKVKRDDESDMYMI